MSGMSLSDLAARQARVEAEQREQWEQIHATRDRVAATEAGMERLWQELHNFRTEAREDSREMTQAIMQMTDRIGTKANVSDETRLHKVESALAKRRGALALVGWVAAVGIPALSAVAGTIYYLTSAIGD